MNESPNKSVVVVGLFVFIGIAFLVVGVLMIGDLHETFKKKIQITALFEDVNGLQKGNNVWFSGVKIGTVSDLRFYAKSQVAVNLKIEIKVQQYIRKNAKIKIYQTIEAGKGNRKEFDALHKEIEALKQQVKSDK